MVGQRDAVRQLLDARHGEPARMLHAGAALLHVLQVQVVAQEDLVGRNVGAGDVGRDARQFVWQIDVVRIEQADMVAGGHTNTGRECGGQETCHGFDG